MIIIPIKWLFYWEYTLFSDKPNDNWGTEAVLDWEAALLVLGSPWSGKTWLVHRFCQGKPPECLDKVRLRDGVPSGNDEQLAIENGHL